MNAFDLHIKQRIGRDGDAHLRVNPSRQSHLIGPFCRAKFGLKCVVYMGAHDVERQAPNVFRMRLLGAEIVPVTSGRGTLKDAMNEGLRDWVANVRDTYYCIGTVAGPHPFPMMVRDFHQVIGREVPAEVETTAAQRGSAEAEKEEKVFPRSLQGERRKGAIVGAKRMFA